MCWLPVAAYDGEREHPQGYHHGEVEGTDARRHTQGLAVAGLWVRYVKGYMS